MRYLPHTPEEIDAMLGVVGADSLEQLFAPVPADCRPTRAWDLPEPKSEWQLDEHLAALGAAMGTGPRTRVLVGAGSYRHHLAGQGQVEFGHRLDRLERAEHLAPGDGVAYGRQFDVDDVAQLVLGIVGHADAGGVAADPRPFVLVGVADIVGQVQFVEFFHAGLLGWTVRGENGSGTGGRCGPDGSRHGSPP